MNLAILNPSVLLRIRKEAHVLRWPALVTVALPYLLSLWFKSDRDAIALTCFFTSFTGFCIMAAALFGHEFEFHTQGLLLSQPISRSQLWNEKILSFSVIAVITLAALAPVTAWLAPNPLWNGEHWSTSFLRVAFYALPVLALCFGPYFTLVSRNLLAGAMFATVVPLACGGGFWLLTDWMDKSGWTDLRAHSATVWLGAAGLLVVMGTWFARRGYDQFLRLAVVGTGQDLDLHQLGQPFAFLNRPSKTTVFHHHAHPWRLLLFKELRLHNISFVLAGLLLPCVALFWIAKWTAPQIYEGYLSVNLAVYGLIFALINGASGVTEERFLGVHEWQRTLPGSPVRQYLLKWLVTLVLYLVLGWGLPALLLWFTADVFHLIQTERAYVPTLLFGFVGLQITTIGFACSTLCRTTLRAMLLTVVLVFAALLGFGLMADAQRRTFHGDSSLWWVALTGILSLIAATLAGVYPCYLRSGGGKLVHTVRAVWVCLMVIGSTFFASAIAALL